jgi:hypothetical protein
MKECEICGSPIKDKQEFDLCEKCMNIGIPDIEEDSYYPEDDEFEDYE